jgi:hypothetical protein
LLINFSKINYKIYDKVHKITIESKFKSDIIITSKQIKNEKEIKENFLRRTTMKKNLLKSAVLALTLITTFTTTAVSSFAATTFEPPVISTPESGGNSTPERGGIPDSEREKISEILASAENLKEQTMEVVSVAINVKAKTADFNKFFFIVILLKKFSLISFSFLFCF